MQREYFCGGCGLFHWVDEYVVDKHTGELKMLLYPGCPNQDCISHQENDVAILAVDTIGYAYFAERHKQFIEQVKWSSSKFAPEKAIEMYQQQGIPIKVL